MSVAALRLIALTGLRREEACGLRWSEIDLAGGCLRLAQTKTVTRAFPFKSAANRSSTSEAGITTGCDGRRLDTSGSGASNAG
jgi:integrase